MRNETFPIDLSALQPLKLDPAVTSLSDTQKATFKHNIQLCRDAIVFFTALAGAKGLSGHTGGAYDTVPEVMIVRAFIANAGCKKSDEPLLWHDACAEIMTVRTPITQGGWR